MAASKHLRPLWQNTHNKVFFSSSQLPRIMESGQSFFVGTAASLFALYFQRYEQENLLDSYPNPNSDGLSHGFSKRCPDESPASFRDLDSATYQTKLNPADSDFGHVNRNP